MGDLDISLVPLFGASGSSYTFLVSLGKFMVCSLVYFISQAIARAIKVFKRVWFVREEVL